MTIGSGEEAQAVTEQAVEVDETPQSYTSESAPAAPATPRTVVTAPGSAVGRRKQAIARVRLVPGTGK